MNNYGKKDISYAVAKIEILSDFLTNPHTRDTLAGFSRRLGLELQLLYEVMEELIETGIVEKNGNRDNCIYRLKTSYATLDEYPVIMRGE